MREFCPKCGTEKPPFFKGFCENCFVAEHELVELPEEIPLDYCPRCEKFKFKNKWIEFDEDKLRELVLTKLKPKDAEINWTRVRFLELTEGKKIAVLEINASLDGQKTEFDKKTVIKLHSNICDACMKSSSNYFEATIQVRFESEPSSSKINELMGLVHEFLEPLQKQDSLAQITDLTEQKKGFDLKLGSKKAAKDLADFLARKFNSNVIFSHSLIGMKPNGKPKKRFTFCVRINP
ncbi:MAG: 60S ribosomal export protein NMD3 [Candidatus Diapherotrites archaeon]